LYLNVQNFYAKGFFGAYQFSKLAHPPERRKINARRSKKDVIKNPFYKYETHNGTNQNSGHGLYYVPAQLLEMVEEGHFFFFRHNSGENAQLQHEPAICGK